jgi:two-component system OmpR family response regulator
MQVLVIDRDEVSLAWLAKNLEPAGFKIIRSTCPDQARRMAVSLFTVAIVVGLAPASRDTALHDLKRLRSAGLTQPLLLLTPVLDWRDKVALLDAGCDDIVQRPARPEEIAARLRAIVRRQSRQQSSRLEIGDLEVDLKARGAWLNGVRLDLSRMEYRLLQLFALYPGRILSHREIRSHLGFSEVARSANSTEVLVARLRKKVGKGRIQTERGLGYRFDEAEDLRTSGTR